MPLAQILAAKNKYLGSTSAPVSPTPAVVSATPQVIQPPRYIFGSEKSPNGIDQTLYDQLRTRGNNREQITNYIQYPSTSKTSLLKNTWSEAKDILGTVVGNPLARVVLPKKTQIAEGFIKPEEKTVTERVTTAIKKYGQTFKEHPVESTLYTLEGAASGIRNAAVDTFSTLKNLAPYTSPLSFLPSYREAVKKNFAPLDIVKTTNEKISKPLEQGAQGEEGYGAVRSVGEMAGSVAPYIVSDMFALKAVDAMGALAKTYKLVSLANAAVKYRKPLGAAVSFASVGQILHQPEDGSRAKQLAIDLAMAGAFEVGGLILRKTLSAPARAIYNKLKEGKKIILEEGELLLKELKSNQAGFAKLPGFSKLNGAERDWTLENVKNLDTSKLSQTDKNVIDFVTKRAENGKDTRDDMDDLYRIVTRQIKDTSVKGLPQPLKQPSGVPPWGKKLSQAFGFGSVGG